MATEKRKMLAGELYVAIGEELAADARRVAEWMDRYNASIASTQQQYEVLLREMLAEVGEGSYILPPFHCDYGYNIHLGKGVFLNFNCVILDVVKWRSATARRSAPGCRSSPLIIRATRDNGAPAWNSGGR
jgi:maltose O-acetyltransferase